MKPNWPLLGGVRFLLALIVTVTHFRLYAGVDATAHPIREALIRLTAMGAVHGFFLISGFSIAASIERDQKLFYFRRALRIFPLYVPIMVFAAVLPAFFGDCLLFRYGVYYMPIYEELALNLCMMQTFLAKTLANNGVAWSLAVEVALYVLAPWFARQSNATLKRLVYLSAGCYVLAALITPGHWFGPVGGGPLLCLAWLWLIGFLIYRRAVGFSFAVVLGVIVSPLQTGFFVGPWYPAIWILCVGAATHGHLLQLPTFARRVLSLLGDASYPLYLAHLPFFALLVGLGYSATNWFLFAAVGASIALDLLYDRPVKRVVLKLASLRTATSIPSNSAPIDVGLAARSNA